MKIAPQNRSGEIVDQLNMVLAEGIYADPSSWNMRQIKRSIDQVLNVAAASGWSVLGSYFALTGDMNESKRCFNASLRLERHAVTVGNYYASFGNLGYFSEAHAYLQEVGKPSLGALPILTPFAETMGSFQTIVSLNKEAVAMGIATTLNVSEACIKAAEIFSRLGISDEQIVQHLDAAGYVLRAHEMFTDGEIEVDTCDIEGIFVGVTCILHIDKSAADVFQMNVELASAERILNIEKHPAFDVVFKPV